MFQSARIKLTIWYILITMCVSILFSLIIFSFLHRELMRNEFRIKLRLERAHLPPPRVDTETIESAIKVNLLYVNLIILGIASLAGYFLSGRTLRPIKEMVDQQNQFIADASHELRTPLTALKTAIEVNLRDEKLNLKQAKDTLKENLADVDKLKSLSENLLTLVTLQGSLNHFSSISIKDVLQTAMSKINYLAKAKKVEIKTSIKEAVVSGNKDRLIELFVILLDNAVKYSPNNKIITVSSEKEDSHAVIKIKDEGIGISEKELPHIFERFYRVDKSRASSTKGYGLGLAIANEIVHLHKGSISVESKEKKGSTFIVKLPLK
ncbi:hypothetical protein A2866_02900 [Candidatus Roizmanbacteria bacterium RIFCSPHIGHO2_01_FULL_39_8]|uniref:histidine kinase n=3 Tax=Candidatus Roizmaniibacteriota TaxID=1752723 RepID=A0A1F7GGY8_9BACT|nr:MAG: hypothetical protein A2866_02900 [Candidatus Roizmanbacteria bacterium RIFCSPHIGHO2_01_FULL_39_8]OGK27561.1 MAG: hypothetical protein A3C28_06035 [Candidatus Roizmanbacteria bacterium RIFCSPHIGHO2_02_FULL_39_9]OGK38155.1 MAG: hypothetical protein A3F60_03130 [Candidatus Roizmanbacteria bacterium RIFCSPHIGHO2_12_FULL_39_8]